jgi:Domain of unknown function (DUF4383)
VNHHLRPLYRVLAAFCGLYVLAFGIAAVAHAADAGFFARDGLPTVLGLRGNRAFAFMSILAGVALIVAAVVGGNIDRWVNLVGGIVFLAAGMVMMTVMQTGLNLLGFTMTTCVVSFVIGLVLFAAGLYGRTD